MEGLVHKHSIHIATSNSSEVFAFPPGYTVIHRDCSLDGGGAFLCFCVALPVVEQPSLSSDAEAVWAKLTFNSLEWIQFIFVLFIDHPTLTTPNCYAWFST